MKNKTIEELVNRLIEINREVYRITEELARRGVDSDGDPFI